MKALRIVFFGLTVLLRLSGNAQGQGTAFTYQGRLNSNGGAATGTFDLSFALYTNVSTGVSYGLVTNSGVAVSNGLFTTAIDFGSAFNGTKYWLEIGVRTNGSTGAFTILAPRQAISPTPYAINAASASTVTGTVAAGQLTGTLPATVLSGNFSNSVTFTNATNSFAGNGAGLTGVPTPTQSNYLLAVDTSSQSFPTTNFITLPLSQPLVINGWSVNTNGTVTAPQAGLYQVSYQVHIENLYSQPVIHMGRVLLNGTLIISGSETIATVPASYGIENLSKTFLVNLTSGETLMFQAASGYGNNYSIAASGTYLGIPFYELTITIIRLQ